MEHSKQNIASLIVVKTQLSYEHTQDSKDSQESENIERRKEVSAVEALVNLFQLRQQAARDNEMMNCKLSSMFYFRCLYYEVLHILVKTFSTFSK